MVTLSYVFRNIHVIMVNTSSSEIQALTKSKLERKAKEFKPRQIEEVEKTFPQKLKKLFKRKLKKAACACLLYQFFRSM